LKYQFFAFPQNLVLSGIWAKLSYKAKAIYATLGALINRKTNQSPFSDKTLSKYSGISVYRIKQATNELEEQNLINTWWHGGKKWYSIIRDWEPPEEKSVDEEQSTCENRKQQDSESICDNSKLQDSTEEQNRKQQDSELAKIASQDGLDCDNSKLQEISSSNKRYLVSVCDSLVEKYFSAIGQSHAPEQIRKNTHTIILSLLEEGYSSDQIEFTIDYAVLTKGKENIYSPNFLQWIIGEALSNRGDVEQKLEDEEQQAERQAEIEGLESEKKKVEERIEEIWAKVEEYRETLPSEKIAEYKEKVLGEIEGGTMITETFIDMLINQHLMKEIGLEEEYDRLREEVKEYENQLI